jgi:hypothetical protein
MKNLNKSSDGMYHISGGAKYEKLIGSRAQVWHGTAYKTSGGLTKSHLIQNKNGRIVSKNKHIQSKKEKRLLHHGYGHKKGKFVLSRKKSRKFKGGSSETATTEPTENTESSPTFFSSLNNIMKSFTGGKSKKRRGGGVASNAAPISGGRSRRRRLRGGTYSLGSGDVAANAAKVEGIKTSPQNMQLIASNYGGRTRRRRLRGGNVAENAAPVGNKNYMGGKKRSKKHKKRMRGGIYSQGSSGVAANASNWNSKDWGMDQGSNLQQIATQYSD